MFSQEVQDYWRKFCQETGVDPKTTYDAWSFGDNKAMSDDLLEKVLSGVKTTTAGSVLEHELNKWTLPQVGDYVVSLDGDQKPRCVFQYQQIKRMKYIEMDDIQFAQDEGEGFDTLEIWREAHWGYFSRVLAQHGREMTEDHEIFCAWIKVIYH